MNIQPTCKIHGVPLVCFCPACRGAVTSKRKARSSRRNGKRGGRPKRLSATGPQARLKQQAPKADKKLNGI